MSIENGNPASSLLEVYEGNLEDGWRTFLEAKKRQGWKLDKAELIEHLPAGRVRTQVLFIRQPLDGSLYSL